MTTAEMIIAVRQLADNSFTVDMHKFLYAVADRLDRLEKLKNHFLDAEAAIQLDPGCKSEPSV